MNATMATLDRYAATSFMSATPIQQRILLLEGAIRAATRSAASLRRNALDDAHRFASIGRALVLELISTLRHDACPAPSGHWRAWLLHVHRLLAHAVVDGNPEALEEAAALLSVEREAWLDRTAEARLGRPARTSADAVA